MEVHVGGRDHIRCLLQLFFTYVETKSFIECEARLAGHQAQASSCLHFPGSGVTGAAGPGFKWTLGAA